MFQETTGWVPVSRGGVFGTNGPGNGAHINGNTRNGGGYGTPWRGESGHAA
jgi:hypothetical protein